MWHRVKRTTHSRSFKTFFTFLYSFSFVLYVQQSIHNWMCYGLVFLCFKQKCAINVLLLKHLLCLIITLFRWQKIDICHMTHTCHIYSLQLETLKMGVLNLKNSCILSKYFKGGILCSTIDALLFLHTCFK